MSLLFSFSSSLSPLSLARLLAIPSLFFSPYFLSLATDAESIILDSEILLMDTNTRRPLPFGTLGVHKGQNFKGAVVCLFVFDISFYYFFTFFFSIFFFLTQRHILYLNGKPLLDMPIKERRILLEANVNVIPNRVELSELTIVKHKKKKGRDDSKFISSFLLSSYYLYYLVCFIWFLIFSYQIRRCTLTPQRIR